MSSLSHTHTLKERAKKCSEERVSVGKHVAAGEGMDSEEDEDEEDSVWKKMKVVGERPSKTKSATKTKSECVQRCTEHVQNFHQFTYRSKAKKEGRV